MADLISKLPDHVIHHILSFLPTVDVVRMSFLSKRWRRMWFSVPTLRFQKHDVIISEFFYDFVDKCLEQRKIGMQHDSSSVMTSFKIKMNYRGDSSQVDRWLSFAAQPHLQELDVNTKQEDLWREYYCFPLVSLNLTSLTILRLKHMKLEYSPAKLPSLKALSLNRVQVDYKVLHNLVLHFPSLQKLLIKNCNTLVILRISSSSLKSLDIDGDFRRIQVVATNLESFVYCGSFPCKFYLASCKKVTSLSMTNANFYCDEDFKKLISGFPLLESLTLKGCDLIDIQHESVKVLVFEKWEDWEDEVKYEITIDTPNLVSFDYFSDCTLVQIFMNSPNLLEANISLIAYWDPYSMEWYVNIINFLSGLDCSKSMSLVLHSEEALIFPENLRKVIRSSPLPNLKHLKIKTWHKLEGESDLEKSLRWLSPSLETLSIV